MTNETSVTQPATEPPKQEEATVPKSSSPANVPSKSNVNKQSDAARYAALRNHRIRLEDAIDPDAERVSKIHKHDILFGRGKGFQNHPGNQRMREIVEKYKIKYHTLRRTEKQELIEAVFIELTQGGARFLKKLEKEDVWVNVDRPVALQKVSHTLRCRKGVLDKVMNDKAAVRIPTLSSLGMSQQQKQLFPNALAGLHASYTAAPAPRASSPVQDAQRLSATNSLSGLEAQRLAALERFRTLTTMPFLQPPTQVPSLIDQYNNFRQGQIMRELLALQQQQMQPKQALQGMGLLQNLAGLAVPANVASASPTAVMPVKPIVNR